MARCQNGHYARPTLGCLEGNRLILWNLSRKSVQILPIPPSSQKVVYEINRLLKMDTEGQLYFNHQGRIMRLNRRGELETIWENTQNPNLQISAFFIDRSDVLWLGISSIGLLKVDLQASAFKASLYQSSFIAAMVGKMGYPHLSFPHWATNRMSYYLRQVQDAQGNLYFCHNFYDHNEIFRVSKDGIQSFKHVPPYAIYTAMVAMPNGEIRVFNERQVEWFCWKSPEAVPDTLPIAISDIKGMVAKEIGNTHIMQGVEFADAR